MHSGLQKFWAKVSTVVAKLVTGFPLHSECVWPGKETDLFLAHRSIYEFFSGWVRDRRVLDAGSGAGYGADLLARAGARTVLAVDLDPRFVRYSRRRYPNPRVEFMVGDCAGLSLPDSSIDLIVSSNMLEHLRNPAEFLGLCKQALTATGTMLVAVPWIVDEATLEGNRRNPWHRTNLRVDEWSELFARCGWEEELWIQTFDPATGVPDFLDPRPSPRPIEHFQFQRMSVAEACRTWSLGVIFHLTPAKPSGRMSAPSR